MFTLFACVKNYVLHIYNSALYFSIIKKCLMKFMNSCTTNCKVNCCKQKKKNSNQNPNTVKQIFFFFRREKKTFIIKLRKIVN